MSAFVAEYETSIGSGRGLREVFALVVFTFPDISPPQVVFLNHHQGSYIGRLRVVNGNLRPHIHKIRVYERAWNPKPWCIQRARAWPPLE
jgi:hypothetical protein